MEKRDSRGVDAGLPVVKKRATIGLSMTTVMGAGCYSVVVM